MVSLINIVNEERIYVNKPSIYTYINLFYQSGTLKNSFIKSDMSANLKIALMYNLLVLTLRHMMKT